MNLTKKATLILVLGAIALGVVPFAAQAAGAKKNQHVNGAVTAVDTTANTVTILDKKTSSTITVSVSPDTKFTESKNVGLEGLAVGDRIRATAKEDLIAGVTTVDATRIEILSPLSEPAKHVGKKSVEGSIVTLAPNLTISSDDGTTYTINTAPKVQVLASFPATFSDVVVGKHIQAIGKLDGTTFEASAIVVAATKEHHTKAI